jgi:hypothetical protein
MCTPEHRLGEGERIVHQRELAAAKLLRHVDQHGRRLGQDALLGDQRRHAALGVDLEILGGALLGLGEVDAHRLVGGTDFFQRDVRRKRDRVLGVVERQHGPSLVRRAPRAISDVPEFFYATAL